jgi:hypothetical protein
MKIKHTTLGALASKKTVIAGAATLALVGGIAPALINNTFAEGSFVLLRESLYTTVGPDYFTRIDLDGITDQDYDIDIEIADTSVATRYYGQDSSYGRKADVSDKKGKKRYIDSDYCSYDEVLCLQGKKIGNTDITIYVNGNAYYYNLVSVKLTPEALNVGAFGDSFSGAATIEGADESLLTLDDYENWGNAYVSISGSRGTNYRINSDRYSSNNSSYYGDVELNWKIGNQYVGGGTYFEFIPLVVTNNIDDSEETDALLKNEALSLFKSLWSDPELYDSSYINVDNYETETGALVNIHFSPRNVNGPTDHYEITAGVEDAELSSTTKNKLAEKLPGKVSDIKYKKVSVAGDLYYYYYNGAQSQLNLDAPAMAPIDIRKIEMGEFTKFSTSLNIALNVSDAPVVKDGYTRKYYVAMENGNKVELVDAKYNEKTNTLSFDTQYFGNFAYGYVDEKKAPVVPNTGTAPKQVAMVATATFAPLALIALGAVIARNKKKATKKLSKKLSHFE